MPANTKNQCAAVNFATGSNETLGDSCKNSTASFKAEWANSTESEDSGHSGHSGHSDSASATPSESAAASTTAAEGSGAIATAGMGAFVGGMGALVAALML